MALPVWRLVVSSALITLSGSFVFAYHVSIINVSAPILQKFLNDSIRNRYGIEMMSEDTLALVWSFLVSSQGIGCVIGCLMAGWTAERFGRKITIT